MNTIGPVLSLPIGLTVFTVVCVIIYMIASEVLWRVMEHLPEDEESWSEERHFEIREED